jgi:hypothetical protein
MMANNNTRNTFLKMLLFIGLASTSTAFTVNTPIVVTQTHNAAISPLFHAAATATGTVTVPNRSTQRSLSQRTQIQMTEDSNNDDEADITPSPIVEVDSSSAQSSASTSTGTGTGTPTKKKERSGFVTAMVMGPPLIFKFGIVLVVKVLTDLVVFPLLWLYRVCRLIKTKVLGLLPASVSSSINGDGVSDKDIREGKVNGHS